MNEMALLETALNSDSVADVGACMAGSSVAGVYDHRCNGSVVTANRLSAPECNIDTADISLCKSRTSSSLGDVNESQFVSFPVVFHQYCRSYWRISWLIQLIVWLVVISVYLFIWLNRKCCFSVYWQILYHAEDCSVQLVKPYMSHTVAGLNWILSSWFCTCETWRTMTNKHCH